MVNIRLRNGGRLLHLLLAGAVGLTLGAAVLVHTRTEILSLRYKLNALLQHEADLRSDVEKLRLEAAVLAAPRALERKALSLGLRYPSEGQVIALPDVAAKEPR